MFNSSPKLTHLVVAHPFNGWQLNMTHLSPAQTAPAPAVVVAAQAAPVTAKTLVQDPTKFGVIHVPIVKKWLHT